MFSQWTATNSWKLAVWENLIKSLYLVMWRLFGAIWLDTLRTANLQLLLPLLTEYTALPLMSDSSNTVIYALRFSYHCNFNKWLKGYIILVIFTLIFICHLFNLYYFGTTYIYFRCVWFIYMAISKAKNQHQTKKRSNSHYNPIVLCVFHTWALKSFI